MPRVEKPTVATFLSSGRHFSFSSLLINNSFVELLCTAVFSIISNF